MQSQQITTNPVHIKVAYENEFRRFLLTPVSFEQLETTLKNLFSLNAEFRIKFKDDEDDWVLLTSDQELIYATELSGSPLRLQVSINPSAQPAENARGRGGKGCRGRGLGRGGLISPEERLTAKSSRLADRIAELEEKINSGKLTADRERVIRWRLLKLQDKLAVVKSKKESFANAPSQSTEAVAASEPVSAENVKVEEKPSCGGGRRGRGCGRGGWRRAMMNDGTDHPVRECPVRERKPRVAIPPEIIENFRQCKSDLRAARESGDAEKIQSCMEAFKTARAAKFEARVALRAQASVDEQKL
jgi:hypothetical protein